MTCSTDCLFEGRFELFLTALLQCCGTFYVRIDTYAMNTEEAARLKQRAMETLTMMGMTYKFTEQGARMKAEAF